jgi:predicted AlkP superfamily pyrophosphatase or phosphodiesterase
VRALLPALLLALPASAAAPRLGVVVVVDQMRPEYLDRPGAADGGFRRLRRESARFAAARHLHAPTETCPGHAAISSGRLPREHGVVANDWYDRASGRVVYCAEDAVYGRSPARLLGPTLADAFKAAVPRGRVFAVSSKDRGAIMLGGRRPDLVLWLDRKRGEFTTSSYYPRPAWLDAFNARFKKTGLQPVKDGRVPVEIVDSPATDRSLELLVEELIRRERVGAGPGRDLLMISFSGTDLVGHAYGLDGPAMDEQLRALDAILGRLLARLEKASGGDLALALSADHGAIPSAEDSMGRELGVRRYDWVAFGRALEAALQAKWPAPGRAWIESYQLPFIYLDRSLAAEKGLDWPDFRRRAAKVLSGVEGAGRGVAAEDAAALPASDPLAAVLRRSYDPSRVGDLWVIPARGALMHDRIPGTTHGTPWDYDALVPLLFWGRGVEPGFHETEAAVVDLAPTLARLLGLDYPPGDGARVRDEVLAR